MLYVLVRVFFFGYVGTTGMLSGSVLDFMFCDGRLPFSDIS
jgi:hypothetical protein